MKNKLMKAAALLAAMSMTVGLTACGNSGKQESGAADNVSTAVSSEVQKGSEETTTEAEEPVEMTTVQVWSNYMAMKETVERVVENFNETIGVEKGIYIELTMQESSAYNQALALAFETNSAPDIFIGMSKERVESGYLLPISELPGLEEIIERRRPYMAENNHYYVKDGEEVIYNLPAGVSIRGLVYNKDMFREAGLVDENGEPTPPVTWEEYREYAKILTNKDENKYGVIFPMAWSGFFASDVSDVCAQDGGHRGYDYTTGLYDYSVWEPAMETVLGIIEDGSCMPGSETLDNDTARSLFSEGIIGMKMSYSFDVSVYNNQFPAKCDWGVAPLPVADEDNMYYQRMTVSAGYCVSAESKVDKEKLATVVAYLGGDEVLKEYYLAGASLPCDASIVADCDTSNLPKGWADYAALTQVSKIYPTMPSTSFTPEMPIAATENFVNKVIPGEMTIAECIKNEEQRMNEGRAYYVELNPDYNPAQHIIKDFDAKR